jgi:hypothetical protein
MRLSSGAAEAFIRGSARIGDIDKGTPVKEV